METIERTYAQMRGPYNDLIKYFGIYNPELSINTSSDWTGDQLFSFREFVQKKWILAFLQEDMGISLEEGSYILDLLWYNANLNFAYSNEKAQVLFMQENFNENDFAWPAIKEDLLQLHRLLTSRELRYEPVQIKIGKGQSYTVQNSMNWLTRIFENQCFRKVFGEISDAQVTEELNKIESRKAAKKKRLEHVKREKRKREKAVACGLSDLFLDNNLVTIAADAKFVKFAKDYLFLMGFISEAEQQDKFFSENIRQWINGSRQERPRLETLPAPVTVTHAELAIRSEDENQQKRFFDLAFPRNK